MRISPAAIDAIADVEVPAIRVAIPCPRMPRPRSARPPTMPAPETAATDGMKVMSTAASYGSAPPVCGFPEPAYAGRFGRTDRITSTMPNAIEAIGQASDRSMAGANWRISR